MFSIRSFIQFDLINKQLKLFQVNFFLPQEIQKTNKKHNKKWKTIQND